MTESMINSIRSGENPSTLKKDSFAGVAVKEFQEVGANGSERHLNDDGAVTRVGR